MSSSRLQFYDNIGSMTIFEVEKNKSAYTDILLIGDEDINMIDKYLYNSHLYVLCDADLKSVCAVLEVDHNTIEIKNIATYPHYQNKGYATKLLEFVCDKYKNYYEYLILGTGENDVTLNFYKKRGFVEYKRIKDFFTLNYSHPIYENGQLLTDMIYLKKKIKK